MREYQNEETNQIHIYTTYIWTYKPKKETSKQQSFQGLVIFSWNNPKDNIERDPNSIKWKILTDKWTNEQQKNKHLMNNLEIKSGKETTNKIYELRI